MPDYVLEVDGEKYNVSTRLAKQTYHMTATIADVAAVVTPVDSLPKDEQEALRHMVRVLKDAPPKF